MLGPAATSAAELLQACLSAPAFIFSSNLGHLSALASRLGASVQIKRFEMYPKDLSSVYGQPWSTDFPPPP